MSSAEIIALDCPVCGEVFFPERSTRVVCSAKCRQRKKRGTQYQIIKTQRGRYFSKLLQAGHAKTSDQVTGRSAAYEKTLAAMIRCEGVQEPGAF